MAPNYPGGSIRDHDFNFSRHCSPLSRKFGFGCESECIAIVALLVFVNYLFSADVEDDVAISPEKVSDSDRPNQSAGYAVQNLVVGGWPRSAYVPQKRVGRLPAHWVRSRSNKKYGGRFLLQVLEGALCTATGLEAADAGTYSYAADVWDNLMQDGYGGGITDGPDNELISSTGGVVGWTGQTLATTGLITTSQLLNGSVSVMIPPNTPTPQPCNPATSHCGHPQQTTCNSVACHKEPFTPKPWTHEDTCGALWAIGGPPLILIPGLDLGPVAAWRGYGTSAGAWIGGAFCL
jgi:hypothetical protein